MLDMAVRVEGNVEGVLGGGIGLGRVFQLEWSEFEILIVLI